MELPEAGFRFVVGTVTLGSTGHFVYLFLRHPAALCDFNRKGFRDRTFLQKALLSIYGAAAAFGIGYGIYRLTIFGLSWMPYSWRDYDEDGESKWTAVSIAGSAAIMGTLAVFSGIFSLAERVTDLENWKNREEQRR